MKLYLNLFLVCILGILTTLFASVFYKWLLVYFAKKLGLFLLLPVIYATSALLVLIITREIISLYNNNINNIDFNVLIKAFTKSLIISSLLVVLIYYINIYVETITFIAISLFNILHAFSFSGDLLINYGSDYSLKSSVPTLNMDGNTNNGSSRNSLPNQSQGSSSSSSNKQDNDVWLRYMPRLAAYYTDFEKNIKSLEKCINTLVYYKLRDVTLIRKGNDIGVDVPFNFSKKESQIMANKMDYVHDKALESNANITKIFNRVEALNKDLEGDKAALVSKALAESRHKYRNYYNMYYSHIEIEENSKSSK